MCVYACARFILHYRTWWVWGSHSLWSTQSLFDVCCALIIYLSGMESRLTWLYLHYSSQSKPRWGACVFNSTSMWMKETLPFVSLTPTWEHDLSLPNPISHSQIRTVAFWNIVLTKIFLAGMSSQSSAGNSVSKWKQCWEMTSHENSTLVYLRSYPLLEITDSNGVS